MAKDQEKKPKRVVKKVAKKHPLSISVIEKSETIKTTTAIVKPSDLYAMLRQNGIIPPSVQLQSVEMIVDIELGDAHDIDLNETDPRNITIKFQEKTQQ